MIIKIAIIGLGFVGGSILKSLKQKIKENELYKLKYCVTEYDKYKRGGIGNFEDCLDSDIIFLALPTLYNDEKKTYEYDSIYEVCERLKENNYKGAVVLKSTILPLTTNLLVEKYKLNFIHNPEFLTARTAYEDFHNQTHIVLGKSSKCDTNNYEIVKELFKDMYPLANISECDSSESECMKIFCNSFYAVKVQIFNEFYLTCQKIDVKYDKVVSLMLKNGWINSMHTVVPGPDKKLSYGGLCFPKDTNALLQFMKNNDVNHKVLEATIEERNEMRDD